VGGKGGGGGRGEMTQALYAHINNKIKKRVKEMPSMVDRIPLPKDVHFIIPRTCEWITLHRKRDFEDLIKITKYRAGNMAWIIQVDPI
jgi:hypothetical protein